jgi:unsaturated pyranuronate lyase
MTQSGHWLTSRHLNCCSGSTTIRIEDRPWERSRVSGRFRRSLKKKISDKFTRRVLAGQKGMMVWWKIGAGTHVAAHSHPHEQLVWIVKGRMEFRIDKKRRVLEAGGIAAIPSGVEHEGWCQEDTEVIDIFAPPREDFLAGGPTWLREK